ncbi:zinc finger protein 346 [Salarias fasciatus]|uniref:zinc finger protein 346 n=1 Tax=Salarias fasciatus TaxID=181472 RepID=UPI001176CFC2|nr:zinc finger protein 346 [Salarias fasciatus]
MAVAMQAEDFPCLPSGPAEINKMIKEHGDLFSDSQCKVCSAVLNSESQKLTHYQSKKHANKVRRYLSIQSDKEPAFKKLKTLSPDGACNNGNTDRSKVCHLCSMTFSSPVIAESHYQSKGHAKNLRLKTVGPPTPAAPSHTPAAPPPKKKPAEEPSVVQATGGGGGGDSNPDRFCSICQASFNNPLMAQQHYVGKKHRKQMTKLKLMETYGPSTTPASTVNGYPCAVCNIELNSVAQYQSHISGAKHKNQVKKSGLGAAEKQHPAEQPDAAAATAAAEPFAPTEEPYDGGEEEPYAAEDAQYSEEYQYT